MATIDYTIRKGDIEPPISYALDPPDEITPNWTGATIRFRMWRVGATAFKVNAIASAFDPLTQIATYDWVSADTDTAGEYLAYWHVTESDGKTWSFPNYQNRRISIIDTTGG